MIFLFFTLIAVEYCNPAEDGVCRTVNSSYSTEERGGLMMVKHIILWKLKDEIADKVKKVKKFLGSDPAQAT